MSIKHLLNQSGVYVLRDTFSGFAYVGSTQHLGERFRQHWTEMKGGRHTNHRLQELWNLRGGIAFECAILEVTEAFRTREIYWINAIHPVLNGCGYSLQQQIHAVSFHPLSECLCTAAASIIVRIDKSLKQQFKSWCADNGTDMTREVANIMEKAMQAV